MLRLVRLAIGVPFLALFLTLLPGPVGASGMTLSIDASHDATAAGGFTPGEPVMVWYTQPNGEAAGYVDRTDALADGSLNWTINATDWATIPADAVLLVAHGQESGVEAYYQFSTSTQPAPAPVPAPPATTSHTLAINTDTLQATADPVFTPGEPVMLWYTLPNNQPAVYFERTDALTDGSLNWTIDPADWTTIPADAVVLVAHGQQSGVEVYYQFAH